jgi:uncharacterized protein (TIGR03000 family)
MNHPCSLRALALVVFVLFLVIPYPAQAGGIAFRLIVGAPPDPNFQEVAGDGVPVLPPRGYSPGYGYPSDYMKLPSLVVTCQRPPPGIVDPGPLEDVGVPAATALFRVRVPENAEVWFSGDKTAQRGSERLFVTPPLAEKSLGYEVRARWRQDGKDVEQTRKVVVHPGDRVTVDFLDGSNGEELPAPRKVEKP